MKNFFATINRTNVPVRTSILVYTILHSTFSAQQCYESANRFLAYSLLKFDLSPSLNHLSSLRANFASLVKGSALKAL